MRSTALTKSAVIALALMGTALAFVVGARAGAMLNGRVMAVSDAKITLVEIVPDGLGGYLERPAALALAD